MAGISSPGAFSRDGRRHRAPQWPFKPDDEITEGGCAYIVTGTGASLRRLLKEARQKQSGPPFTEICFRNNAIHGRLYRWAAILEWLGEAADHLHLNPPHYGSHRSDNDEIKIITDALEKERAYRQRLERELAVIKRPASPPGLLNKSTVLSISLPYTRMIGIYFLIYDRQIVYVGKSVNVHARLAQHLARTESHPFTSVAVLVVPSELLDKMETLYINHFAPAYNRAGYKL